MITIYFDTSFFINLGNAEPDVAATVVDELNQCRVRHVRSPVLFMELARFPHRAENHSRILKRLSDLPIAPFMIGEDHWSELAPGSHREELGKLMQQLDEVDIYVRGVCSAANRSSEYQRFLVVVFGEEAAEIVSLIHAKDPDLPVRIHNEMLRRKDPKSLKTFGEVRPAGDLEKNLIRMLAHRGRMTKAQCEGAGLPTPALPDFQNMNLADASRAFLDWATEAFGEDVMDQLQLRRSLELGTTKGDDRDLRLMEGIISPKSKTRFSSSLRDCGHMAIFASFSDEIDFLQVDGPKLNEIRHRPDHTMRQLGLDARCFAASTLDDVIASVRRAIASAELD